MKRLFAINTHRRKFDDGKFRTYGMTIWFSKGHSKCVSLDWYRGIRKENLREYGNDPDINIKPRWGWSTNGAEKDPEATCFDSTLDLGHLCIGYTNFAYRAQEEK